MLVITSNPSISLFVILEDAHQSLVLQELMKRDEASSKYDAINPHQVYKLGSKCKVAFSLFLGLHAGVPVA
jgi:hypothetical protein